MDIREQKQNEIADNVLNVNSNQIVFVSVRLGKTRAALKVIQPGDRTLVIYPLKDIKKSWEDELKKFTPLSTDITFVTKNSVKKYSNQSFDNVFIDEPQLCASPKQLAVIHTIKFKRRMALTGVLNTKTIKKLAGIGLKIGYKYGIEEAIRDGLVKDYEIFIHFKKLNPVIKVPYEKFKRKFYGTEQEVIEDYNKMMADAENNVLAATAQGNWVEVAKWKNIYKYNMGLRTNFIYNSKTLLMETMFMIEKFKDEKMLIYTLRTDIADLLSDVSYHSKNKEEVVLETFKTATKGHCAVVNCVQAGVTIQHLNRVLFHSYESNTETLHQKLARSLLWEFEGQKSQIHLMCMEGTQMEKWIEQACRSMDQTKIYYVIDNQVYTKLEVIRLQNPGKELYLYDGSVVYYSHMIEDKTWGMTKQYCFIDNPAKSYGLNPKKLQAI